MVIVTWTSQTITSPVIAGDLSKEDPASYPAHAEQNKQFIWMAGWFDGWINSCIESLTLKSLTSISVATYLMY